MRLTEAQIVTPTLLRRFELEAEFEGGNGAYYALILRDAGDLLCHHPTGPAAEGHQQIWAGDVLRRLNRELHHDGAWVVVFTHPPAQPTALHTPGHVGYERYCLIWLDQDGDPQFVQEWQANESEMVDFAEVLLAGIDSTMAKAEISWLRWHQAMIEVIEPREGQTFKRAQGQMAPSTRH